MKSRFIETEYSDPNFIKTFEWQLLQPEPPVLNEPFIIQNFSSKKTN